MSPGAEGGESGANSFWWKQHHGVGWHLQNKVLLHSGPSSSWTGFVGSAARLDPIPCSKTALQETVAVQPASRPPPTVLEVLLLSAPVSKLATVANVPQITTEDGTPPSRPPSHRPGVASTRSRCQGCSRLSFISTNCN